MGLVLNCMIYILLISIKQTLGLIFDQKYFGVTFDPYVMRHETVYTHEFTRYSLQTVKTMLKLVSKKFSRVSTYGNVAVEAAPYKVNSTYYKSKSAVYAAEASALLNLELNQTSLQVIVGVSIYGETQMMVTSMQLALESAKKANEIYPGTVTGLIIYSNFLLADISETYKAINLLKTYRSKANQMGLKMGLREADTFLSPWDRYTNIQNLLDALDFVICENTPKDYYNPEYTFDILKERFFIMRNEIQKYKPNIEVMGQTQWATAGTANWENADKLQRFWELINNSAVEHNYTMLLEEAFDNPWKSWSLEASNHGWWKLSNNLEVHLMEGYVEKVIEFPPPPTMPTTTQSTSKPSPTTTHSTFTNKKTSTSIPWVYIGIGIGVAILVIIFIVVVTFLCVRVKRLTSVLSKADVQEFMTGYSKETVDRSERRESLLDFALNFPYDPTYEVPKEKLKIKDDEILGKGQFGCVFKAYIQGPQDDIEVALQMARSDNCTKQVLKGLLSEIKIMIYLGKHPNLVSIVGAYTAELMNGVVYVATEFCALGSLETYLREHQVYSSLPKQKFERSLKTAKITDFGLSRRMYDYTNYVKKQQEPLPWRWMSIESLKRLEFSAQSDVWSYGVLLWEIFSMGDIPYPGLSWTLDFVEKLLGGMRMKCPSYATTEIYQIMEDCWNVDPNMRPSFGDLNLSMARTMEDFNKIYTILGN